MIWKTRRRATMAAAFCVAAAAAHFDASATQDEPPAAQAPAVGPGTPQNPQPEQVITIHATRDPVDKSYRKMIRGMDRYARQQSLAPGAVLRFRLLPRLPGVGMDGITLKIVGDTITLPVPLAPDHSFTLPRNAQALREDAALIASRRTSSMTWRADVRSPGVPAGMRRLGLAAGMPGRGGGRPGVERGAVVRVAQRHADRSRQDLRFARWELSVLRRAAAVRRHLAGGRAAREIGRA